jgi:hypothetical protein
LSRVKGISQLFLDSNTVCNHDDVPRKFVVVTYTLIPRRTMISWFWTLGPFLDDDDDDDSTVCLSTKLVHPTSR